MKLSGCDIKDSGARALFEEIAQSRSLLVLDLSRNPLTEKCFESLASLLSKNQTLRAVYLNDI